MNTTEELIKKYEPEFKNKVNLIEKEIEELHKRYKFVPKLVLKKYVDKQNALYDKFLKQIGDL